MDLSAFKEGNANHVTWLCWAHPIKSRARLHAIYGKKPAMLTLFRVENLN